MASLPMKKELSSTALRGPLLHTCQVLPGIYGFNILPWPKSTTITTSVDGPLGQVATYA